MGVISWSFVCSDPQSLWLGEFVDLLHFVFLRAGSFVEFQTFVFFVEVLLVLVDFNGFPVQSDVMIAGVVQYFSILK